MSADTAPLCAVESVLWRECLKNYDYSPDKPQSACETQRGGYYACIKNWRETSEKKPYDPKDFELSPECRHEAEKLHNCMMYSMFEVSKCRKEMALLKRCAARKDPEVRQYLEGDPAIENLESSIDDSTGWTRIWYKAIGKL